LLCITGPEMHGLIWTKLESLRVGGCTGTKGKRWRRELAIVDSLPMG